MYYKSAKTSIRRHVLFGTIQYKRLTNDDIVRSLGGEENDSNRGAS